MFQYMQIIDCNLSFCSSFYSIYLYIVLYLDFQNIYKKNSKNNFLFFFYAINLVCIITVYFPFNCNKIIISIIIYASILTYNLYELNSKLIRLWSKVEEKKIYRYLFISIFK